MTNISKEAIEREAKMMVRSQNLIWARKIRKLAAERDALAAEVERLRNVAVEVRELEWGEKDPAPEKTSPGWSIEADSGFSWVYRIDYFSSDKINGGPFLLSIPWGEDQKDIETPEAAKAAAQADYERRILSAIQPRPASEVYDEAIEVAAREQEKAFRKGVNPEKHADYIRQLKRGEG